MVEITSTGMIPPTDGSQEFCPMCSISNHRLQTMLPHLIHRKMRPDAHWQCLELPDGDFVDLAWNEDPQQVEHKPCLAVLHGLEDSLNSPYVHGLIEAAQKHDWLGVVMHSRGCSGKSNRLNHIYHSDGIEDDIWFLHWLEREFGRAPTAAVGYSLGGNMLICLLAEEGNDIPVDAMAIVSAPFVLKACSYHIDKGFSRVHQRYLLDLLEANVSRKLEAYPSPLPVGLAQLKSLRRVRGFDGLITTKIHGFAGAADYYHQCNTMSSFDRIAKPTPIIHAKDDPLMNHHMIPGPENLSSQMEYQLTKHGGHVGFIDGTMCRPEAQLGPRVPDWLTTYLGASS